MQCEVPESDKLCIFNNAFWELNVDEVTLVGPLLKEFCLNMFFPGDIGQNVRGYTPTSPDMAPPAT